MIYRDDSTYIKLKQRVKVLELDMARITNELDKSKLDYLRDGIYTKLTYRAELVERRSAAALELKELSYKIFDIKELFRTTAQNDLFDELLSVLDEAGYGHLFKIAFDRQEVKRAAAVQASGFITAEEARALGPNNAEFLTHYGDWRPCLEYCVYQDQCKFRAIQTKEPVATVAPYMLAASE
jgi:hypothetical protein